MQLSGLVVAAEYLDEAEAQVSAAALRAENIATHISYDPRHPMMGRSFIGPGTRGTDPIITLLVLASQSDRACAVLEAQGRSLPQEFRDAEVGEWLARLEAKNHRRKHRRRRYVLAWIYSLFGIIVLALLAHGINLVF